MKCGWLFGLEVANDIGPVYSCIFPFHPARGGGIESKDLEMGKESKRWKNEMMKNIKIFHF